MSVTLASNGVLTAAQFRQLQPGFADSSVYTDESIGGYLTLAASMLDPNRWADWRPLGMALMVAHYLSLDAREAKAAARGGIPGQASVGILSSKSIGGVSAGYETSSGAETGAGQWNMTSFGRRYIHMARLVGAGGVQVTGGLVNDTSADRRGPVF